MKIGLCAPADRAAEVKALGFDYLEVNATEIGQMTPEAYARRAAEIKALGIPVLSANCFCPASLNLYGSRDSLAAWLQRVMPRLAGLGVKTVVFGSGGARNKPDRIPYAVAFRSLVQAVRLMGDSAAACGITIAVEPLYGTETNMITCLAEGAALAAAAEHPNVSLLADAFHMVRGAEDPREIARAGGVRHVHVALKDGRRWPVEADAYLPAFMAALKASGYDGCVSVEGNSDDWASDAPRSLRTLRELWGDPA